MKLKAFKVKMYRPILDSGWIDIDDITVLVGKNESGKTAILKALHKFNPFRPEPYALDREWPRGHRGRRSLKAVVVQTRFDFEGEELSEIANILPRGRKPAGIEISKTYGGEYRYRFLPDGFPDDTQLVKEIIGSRLADLSFDSSTSSEFRKAVSDIRDQLINVIKNSELSSFPAQIEQAKEKIVSAVQPDNDKDNSLGDETRSVLGELSKIANESDFQKKITGLIVPWIPNFIYMDDHKPFRGSAFLDEISARNEDQQLTDEDKTFLILFEMAGLDFNKESQRTHDEDKEQRMLDMNDASLTLTNLLAEHWSQRKYQVKLTADGNHVIAFVSDEFQPVLVPLDERSKGFQWFFSFDTTFLHETQGTFKDAVILLDEPGLHLHAAAQRDLLVRLKEYAQGNQLIYTTHLPFMIDMERLDNIRVCQEGKDKGSTVSGDFYSADEHARFPLQAALGLSISQSLFVGQYNLVVEGVTDFWMLSAMATILRSANRKSLDEQVVITPSGGATKAAYVATMLQGQELDVVILLDSDLAGKSAAEGLIKKWIMKDRRVLLIGKTAGLSEGTALEDIFPAEFYLEFVNMEYERELKGNPLTVDEVNADCQPQLVRRIDAALRKRGMDQNSEGWLFNKGRVAKRLLLELPKRKFEDMPDEMIDRFENLFEAINKAMFGSNDRRISGKVK